MNPHQMLIQQMYGGHSSPFAQARAKRQEQKAHLSNPFMMPDQDLMQKQVKEEGYTPQSQKTPWLQSPGMFGIDRTAALTGGLGLLPGMY